MAKPETIRVELSAADRRLLQRVVDALEARVPKPGSYTGGKRLTEPAKGAPSGFASGGYINPSFSLTDEQVRVETNPRLMEKLVEPPPSGDYLLPSITIPMTVMVEDD